MAVLLFKEAGPLFLFEQRRGTCFLFNNIDLIDFGKHDLRITERRPETLSNEKSRGSYQKSSALKVIFWFCLK